MINEKIKQAQSILKNQNVDLWLTFVRESSTNPDPVLELILGAHVTWTSAFVITSSGKAVAIVGSLDAQNIKDHADYEVRTYVDSIAEPLLEIFNSENPKTIAINTSQNDVTADGLTHGMYNMLTDYLKHTPFVDRFVSSEKIIAALRGRKSAAEVDRIKAAIRETLEIFDLVTENVRVGMTEREVAEFIRIHVQNRGLGLAWDEAHCPAVFTGPDTAGAHAGPTDRKIQPGHVMNIDFGVRKDGYVSDLQRTWYFQPKGETEVPVAVQRGFDVIRDAIHNAAAALKPGMQGWQVDAVARNYITEHGYEEYPHGLGHQVGRQAHDGAALLCPKWDRYKDLPFYEVEEGQIYTIEPRLTIDGYGIATIEEIVRVTAEGCEFLSTPQTKLIVIPA